MNPKKITKRRYHENILMIYYQFFICQIFSRRMKVFLSKKVTMNSRKYKYSFSLNMHINLTPGVTIALKKDYRKNATEQMKKINKCHICLFIKNKCIIKYETKYKKLETCQEQADE